MSEKKIILTARVMSLLFTPFYLPFFGLVILFLFSYLSMLPFGYKLKILFVVYAFTILLPTFLIHLYRKYWGWTHIQVGARERRMIPYIISILCYFSCFYLMNMLHVYYFISSVLIAALLIQIVCAIINVWWKISTHTAAIGGVAGALVAYSYLLTFNPVWWLCLVIIVAGIVATSRMILRQHTLLQVIVGFFVGTICAYFAILRISLNLAI